MVEIFPDSTAFDLIFAVGIIMAVVNIAVSLTTRNYRLGSRKVEEAKAPQVV